MYVFNTRISRQASSAQRWSAHHRRWLPWALLVLLIISSGLFALPRPAAAQATTGAALDFDGSDDYVTLPATLNSQFTTNQITVEGWFNPASATDTDLSGWRGMVGEDWPEVGDVKFALFQVDTTVNCGFFHSDTGWQWAFGAPLTLNSWQHIACTYDQQTLKLYVNGTLETSAEVGMALPAGTGAWYLGRRWDATGYYHGRMDEVRFWRRALSQSEIQARMSCQLESTSANLVARYNFNQGTAQGSNSGITTLTDGNGNNYNGTLNNFALSGATANWVAPGAVTTPCDPNTGQPAPPNLDVTGTVITVDDATCTFSAALEAANTDSAQGGCPAGNGYDTIVIAADITVSDWPGWIYTNMKITGDKAERVISGANSYNPFWIAEGTVTIENLTIRNGNTTGWAGGDGANGGGGGGAMGAGGAIFIYEGTTIIQNVNFINNSATGGAGGNAWSVNYVQGGGGGGEFFWGGGGWGATYLDSSPNGGDGQFGSGGGGGNGILWDGIGDGLFWTNNESLTRSQGGSGGALGGNGGKGIGFGSAAGDGGNGLGGAIFIRAGTLFLFNNTFTNNQVGGGRRGYDWDYNFYAQHGTGRGGAIFVCTPAVHAECNAVAIGSNNTFTNNRADADAIIAGHYIPWQGPFLNVMGNQQLIDNGVMATSRTNGTDFGSAAAGKSTVVRTFTIANRGASALTLNGAQRVAVSGAHAGDFSVTGLPADSVAAGGSSTFQITFAPSSVGVRTATVTIPSNDAGRPAYHFTIQGTGIAATNVRFNGSDCTLADAIMAANTDQPSGGCPTGSGADIITVVNDVTLTEDLPAISSDLTIMGDVATRFVSGDNARRVFLVNGGKVRFQNITLKNGKDVGSTGRAGFTGGGGGMGAGGALFINAGAVTVENVTFLQNNATGGGGGATNANWKDTGGNGGGSTLDLSAGGVGGFAAVHYFSAGRWVGVWYQPAYDYYEGGNGAAGAFGGGGGGSGYYVYGGNGGFGGGGGGADFGTAAGKLGGDGYVSGGGGAGLGGAIFIRTGSLTLNNNTFSDNSATGGVAGAFPAYPDRVGQAGGSYGGAIFVCTAAEDASCSATVTGNNNLFTDNSANNGEATYPAALAERIAPQGQPAAGSVHTTSGSGGVFAAGTTQQQALPPGLTAVQAIAGGDAHALALQSNGTVVAWGDNSYGQGVVPAGLTAVQAIAAGANHNLALKSDGTVVAWGDNRAAQSNVPDGLTNVIAIAAGGSHSLALKADGTVVAWGSNNLGESTPPTTLRDVVAIAAGADYGLALTRAGNLVTWGGNGYGQTTLPTNLNGVTAIAAGQYHNLALRYDGTVVAWGRNDFGQSAVPADLANVTAIAANYYTSLALKADGAVVAWGGNGAGQRDLPSDLHGVVAIAAGGRESLAIQATDTSAPETALSNQVTGAGSTDAQFWFTGGDDITPETGLRFQCQLDGAAFSNCTSPQSYTLLTAGSHTFAVKAVDAAGNLDGTPATYTWTVDPLKPSLALPDTLTNLQPLTPRTLVTDSTTALGNRVSAAQATTESRSGGLIDFGMVLVNRPSEEHRFTIRNQGSADLILTSMTLSGPNAGDFRISSAPELTISPGAITTIGLTFTPIITGTRMATLTVNTNDANTSLITVNLQGGGTLRPYPLVKAPDTTIRVQNNQFTVPIQLDTNGADLAAVGFELNYDTTCLTFDVADNDGNGVPNGISGLPAAFAPSISQPFTGTLQIALLDDAPPIATLSDGALFQVTFGVKPACVTTDGTPVAAPITFSTTPAPSFGDPQARDIRGAAKGTTIVMRFNAAPTALALSNNLIDENSAANTTVGSLSVTDPDGADTHSYSLVAGAGDRDNAAFTISGTTLKTAISLNYEPRPEYFIRVRVTDNGGLAYEQALVVRTGDLSEAPEGIATTDGPSSDGNPATLDIQENQPVDTLIAKLDPSNPDSNNRYTYALVTGNGSSDNASFTVVDNQLRSAVVFNYEAKASYTIRLRITDKQGRSVEQAFTVVINNVAEPFSATDDAVDPRTTVFLGGQTATIDVLANDVANGATLTVASVTQPAAGQGSVTNNTANVSYTAPQANGSTTFTYQASNGVATSNDATVSVSYVANHTRGDCNSNGNVAAADFIAIVLEIFDANDTKDNGAPAWWLTYTGDYPGSPLGCDANNSRNGANNSSDSITAADITCSVLIFFGHPCGTGLQAASADQAASLSVAAVANGGQSSIPVTLKTGGQAVAAAAFALELGDAAFDATDANSDGIPDAVTLTVPASVTKSVVWNAQRQRLEVALYGASLPLPTLSDGVLAMVMVDGVATPSLTQVSLSDANGNDLLVPTRTGLFLPLIAR